MTAFLRLLLLVLFVAFAPAQAEAATPPVFQSEQAAQRHCPSDTVVWLNLPSGIYHFKGQRYYANTKSDAFVCKRDANQTGNRATRNGQ